MKNKRGLRTKTVVYLQPYITIQNALFRNINNNTSADNCFTCFKELEISDFEINYTDHHVWSKDFQGRLCYHCALKKDIMFCRGCFENEGHGHLYYMEDID